jgi:hypothetical protein
MATWLLPGAPSQPSTIRASTECLFLTWRTRRVAVSKSKTMGSRIPESPPVVASMSRSTLASVRCFRPAARHSDAAGHNSKELGTESKPIEAYRRNAVSGAQGRGPAC